jgi:four helix bundle protein
MNIEKFENLIVWQKSRVLCKSIYKSFSLSNDFGFNNQIQRASVSIMNNIAEGFERKSNKEFRQFLYIAKGSCGEVRSMLHLAGDLEKIEKENCELLKTQSEEISKILSGLIKSLNI